MKEKILKFSKVENKEQIFIDLFFFSLGFILSFAKIAGIIAPFCLAFSFALKKRASTFCFIGSFLNIVLFLNADNFLYLFILALGFLFKFFLNCNSSLKNSIFAATSFIVPHIFSIIFFPIGIKSLVLIYFKTILCASLTALCTQTLKNFSFNFKDNIYNFFGAFVGFVVILISFCNLGFLGFNLGRFIAAFAIVEAFLVYGVYFSSVLGLIATISFALYTKDFAKFGVILAVSGFLAGFFKKTFKFFQILMFISTYLFCCVFFGGFSVESLFEVLVACFVGVLVPKKYIYMVFAKREEKKGANQFKLNDELSLKLKFVADMLVDLQNNINECAKAMDSDFEEKINYIYERTAETVCKNCGLNTFCWITSYNELVRSFCEVSNILRKKGKINQQDLPIFLRKKCCKIVDLVQYLNFSYEEHLCVEQNFRRLNEVREIAAEQFSGISDFLVEVSDELKSIKNIDYEASQNILEILKNNSFKIKSLFCVVDEFERTTVDVYVEEILEKEQVKIIKELISSSLGRNMNSSSFTKAGKNYKISFFEATNFSIQFAVRQTFAGNNSCCGDSFDYFIDGKGFAHVILSDGMGNGKRAALDSLMTCSTLRKFFEAGFEFGSALKLLNLSFALKSKEESFATVDNCTIDLYTGETVFTKAGATASYVVKNGEITKFYSKSLPIGIIQGIDVDRERVVLKKGDTVVMVSDGATMNGFNFISHELKLIYKNDAPYIAERILKLAKEREDENHSDDITVIVFKMI